MTAAPTAGMLDLGDQHLEYHAYPAMSDGGPTVVFLHEGLGCVDMWRDFPARVAAATGCAVVVYSRAGYGRSTPVPLPRPLSYMTREGIEVLPRLLKKLGLDKVILVGHSDGGSISIVHAGCQAVHPGLMGVILMAPHVFNEELCVASIREAKIAFETGDLRARLKKYHGNNVDCAFWGWNGAWLDPGFWHWNIEEFLPTIHVPMMVLQGHDDVYGTAIQWQAICRQSGGPVEVVELEKCGHSPFRDQPKASLAAVTAFIRSRQESLS